MCNITYTLKFLLKLKNAWNWWHWNNYDFLYFFNAWRVVFAINTDKYGICNTRCILHEHCYFGWRTYNGTQFRKSLDYVVVTWFTMSFLVLTTHSAPPHGLADWSRPGFQRIVRRIDIIWAGCVHWPRVTRAVPTGVSTCSFKDIPNNSWCLDIPHQLTYCHKP